MFSPFRPPPAPLPPFSSSSQGTIAQQDLNVSNPCLPISLLAGIAFIQTIASFPSLVGRHNLADKCVAFWSTSPFSLDSIVKAGAALRLRIKTDDAPIAGTDLDLNESSLSSFNLNNAIIGTPALPSIILEDVAISSQGVKVCFSDLYIVQHAYNNHYISSVAELERSFREMDTTSSASLTSAGNSLSITKMCDGSFVLFDPHRRNPLGFSDHAGKCFIAAFATTNSLLSYCNDVSFFNSNDCCFTRFGVTAKVSVDHFACMCCRKTATNATSLLQHCRASKDHPTAEYNEYFVKLGFHECPYCKDIYKQLGRHTKACPAIPSRLQGAGQPRCVTASSDEEKARFRLALSFFDDCDSIFGSPDHLSEFPFFAHVPSTYIPNQAFRPFLKALQLLGPILSNVSDFDHTRAWKALLSLPALALSTKKDENKKKIIRSRLATFCEGGFRDLAKDLPPNIRKVQTRSTGNAQALREKQAIKHAEDRQFARSLRCLSHSNLLSVDDDVLDILKNKHPTRTSTDDFVMPVAGVDGVENDPIVIDPNMLADTLKSLNKNSSPGVFGWRYEFFLPLLANEKKYPSLPIILEAFTDAFNIVLAGKISREISSWLATSKLLPFAKSGGGVRPIAIGTGIRRVVSTLALRASSRELRKALGPCQFGVSVKNGVEYCIHKARYDLLTSRKFLLVFDIKNAFNAVFRDAIFKQVSIAIPSLLPLVSLFYEHPSSLLLPGGQGLFSEEGTQQGDPLAPALFSLALAPVLAKLAEDFQNFDLRAYLDDICVSSAHAEDLIDEFIPALKRELKGIGLELQISKSALVVPEGAHCPDLDCQGLEVIKLDEGEGIKFLGSPVGAPDFVSDFLKDIFSEYVSLCDAILLLKTNQFAKHAKETCFDLIISCVACKFNFIFRTTPIPHDSDFLSNVDELLTKSASRLIDDHENHLSLCQLSKCIFFSKGGTGIHQPSITASHAYTSSLAACCLLAHARGLQTSPLSNVHHTNMPPVNDSSPFCCIADAFRMLNPNAPLEDLIDIWRDVASWRHLTQSALCQEAEDAELKKVFEAELTTREGRAHLLSTASPKANFWRLYSPGIHLNNQMFSMLIRRRFRLPLRFRNQPLPSHCPICSDPMDPFGDHFFSCKKFYGYTAGPHDVVRDCLYSVAKQAGCSQVYKEEKIYEEDNKRSDVFIQSGFSGCPISIDVATSSPVCKSYLAAKSDRVPLAAADFRAKCKHSKYDDPKNNFSFSCFSIENTGALNKEAITLIQQLQTTARSSLNKFHFGDVAHRFIARSFAKSSALALLGCVRKSLSSKSVPFVEAVNASSSDAPAAPGIDAHAAPAPAIPGSSLVNGRAPLLNALAMSYENDGDFSRGSPCSSEVNSDPRVDSDEEGPYAPLSDSQGELVNRVAVDDEAANPSHLGEDAAQVTGPRKCLRSNTPNSDLSQPISTYTKAQLRQLKLLNTQLVEYIDTT